MLNVIGFDPSMRNWGIAKATYSLRDGTVTVSTLNVVQPIRPRGKQIRKNSSDLEVANQLSRNVFEAVQGADAVFVEIPVGSQSARSMASYGICIGILGALRASGIPFYELTPTEVKLAATGDKNATKEQMIEWAVSAYPNANWPTHTRQGVTQVTASQAEHLADAIATIHAGVQSTNFQQLIALFQGHRKFLKEN